MGMAASQARYLSLSARKTNTEYEGQQINQQRLNLSNQSADLFNQMLTMSVPTCPNSNDYTTLQYSWSDGNNTYVLSDYYQIATANSDYNYVVTSYYYTDVYTGSQKKMVEPQIQCTKTNENDDENTTENENDDENTTENEDSDDTDKDYTVTYTAVGNCDLTAISVDDYNSDDTISVAIQQIIADMKTTSSEAYANLSACFSVSGEYISGIYSFQLYGTTYYTTEADLASAVSGAYDDDATASNGIDSQNKLSYYNATYISTKIEETAKALLETDGYGRFTSVKFENNSVTYTLNCETITDEDAYNNAMNQYYYEQEQYDQEVASINAKTEIIQAEDRELQLRLEQLDTEQSALQTEMEACQKVVSKNVEDGFKTFNH